MKGRSATNAEPWSSGSAVSLPAWEPLREPSTDSDLIWSGASVVKVIWEVGEASGVPGNGSTLREEWP